MAGAFSDIRDTWWPPAPSDEALSFISSKVLPFLGDNGSFVKMNGILESVLPRLVAPEKLTLALLRQKTGDPEGALGILEELLASASSGWSERAATIRSSTGAA